MDITCVMSGGTLDLGGVGFKKIHTFSRGINKRLLIKYEEAAPPPLGCTEPADLEEVSG